MSSKIRACIQRGPKSTACLTPCQFLTGCGSRQRKSPVGGCANGIPLKMRTPDGCVPRPSTVPLAVWTRSAACIARAAPRITSAKTKIFITHLYNILEPHRTYCRGGPPWPPGVEIDLGNTLDGQALEPARTYIRHVCLDRVPRRAA